MPRKFTPEIRNCLNCGEMFLARTAPSCIGRGKFCSRRCSNLAKLVEVPARFWPKVDKARDCWLWLGGKDSWGYGALKIRGKQESAHRISWVLAFGPIPSDLWVLHHCDTPACVRPDHLWLGTAAQNAADRDAKGRDRYSNQRFQAATATGSLDRAHSLIVRAISNLS